MNKGSESRSTVLLALPADLSSTRSLSESFPTLCLLLYCTGTMVPTPPPPPSPPVPRTRGAVTSLPGAACGRPAQGHATSTQVSSQQRSILVLHGQTSGSYCKVYLHLLTITKKRRQNYLYQQICFNGQLQMIHIILGLFIFPKNVSDRLDEV